MAGLRRLTLEDLGAGLALSTASGWNQTEADWHRLLTLPSVQAYGIEAEGQLVATTTAIRYGDELAWIGMVLTAESQRGRGFASQLLEAALNDLADCALVKLDATEQGAPLYRRFGFLDEGPITRYRGRPEPKVAQLGDHPGPDVYERAELLRTLGEPFCLSDGSFSYARPGRVLPFFGPCVGSAERGEELLRHYAIRETAEFFFDRMGEAPEGFRPARELTRMYRGKYQPTNPHEYCGAGFEFG
ncbi:MAG: GNAT family N-acetyltransferase [Bryobacteraceae bacterium]|nr:GNAT family N-acetyltransferase [Bryobacteraceae bacterium]